MVIMTKRRNRKREEMRVKLVAIVLVCLIIIPMLPVHAQETGIVVVAVGDISCRTCQQAKTVALVAVINPDIILTLGDQDQTWGKLADYQKYFDPTWGQFKSIIHPVIGNHDYGSDKGRGYFTYFGEAAGDPAKAYYSFDVGTWHIIALDSVRTMKVFNQETPWLEQDLASSSSRCTIAYWHQPEQLPRWKAILNAAHVDIVLAGHNHVYRRINQTDGFARFTVGTGGAPLLLATSKNSRNDRTIGQRYGVLKLTLYTSYYTWEFIGIKKGAPIVLDSGTRTC